MILLVIASQVAGITGMYHHTWPRFLFLYEKKIRSSGTVGLNSNKKQLAGSEQCLSPPSGDCILSLGTVPSGLLQSFVLPVSRMTVLCQSLDFDSLFTKLEGKHKVSFSGLGGKSCSNCSELNKVAASCPPWSSMVLSTQWPSRQAPGRQPSPQLRLGFLG
jgi:hypothetical protein